MVLFHRAKLFQEMWGGIGMLLIFCRRTSAGQAKTTDETRRYLGDLLRFHDEKRRERVEASRYSVKIRKRIESSMKNVLDVQSEIEEIGSVLRVMQCINRFTRARHTTGSILKRGKRSRSEWTVKKIHR